MLNVPQEAYFAGSDNQMDIKGMIRRVMCERVTQRGAAPWFARNPLADRGAAARQDPFANQRTLLLLMSFLFVAGICWAEEPVQIKARAWPARVTLGDEVRLVLQVDHPQNFSVTPPHLKMDLSPFEIKRIETEAPRYSQGRVKETFRMALTIFELGDLKIPSVSLRYTDSSKHGGVVISDPIPMKVVSVPKRVSDKNDIRPIKGPVSMDFGAVRAFFLSLFAVLLTVFLVVKIILRRKRFLEDLESLKPPHERAILELERLRNGGMLESGNVKGFYSELADILRRYLERRFSMDTLDKTTAEITRELKDKEFTAAVLEKITQVLEKSDLVKFAKLVPKRSLADELVTQLVQMVDETKPTSQKDEKK